jgi:hypothetical protein
VSDRYANVRQHLHAAGVVSQRAVRRRSVPPGIVTPEPQTGRERPRVWNAKYPRTCPRGSLTPCLRVWHPRAMPGGDPRYAERVEVLHESHQRDGTKLGTDPPSGV